MKILNIDQIREADNYTILTEPISSIDLMERASMKCTDWIIDNINSLNKIFIFAGTGNNGGDGLAIARQLFQKKLDPQIFLIKSNHYSSDLLINLERLKQSNIKISIIDNLTNIPIINNDCIIIDAIFGSGLNKKIEGIYADIIKLINNSKAQVISIDFPSGLINETINTSENIVNATHTLSFQNPKLSFFLAENDKYVGNWHILDIGLSSEFLNSIKSNFINIDIEIIKKIYKTRHKFSHKGAYGHSLLIAGSKGKYGAAVLAAKACLKSGVGLLTVNIPSDAENIIHCTIPEAMTENEDENFYIKNTIDYSLFSCIAIGPGIDKKPETKSVLEKLLKTFNKPIVLDADALNIISESKDLLNYIPNNSILTPHLKEFDRLTKIHPTSFERLCTQIEFSKKFNVFLIVKGAHSSITCPDGLCYINSTGNAGLATAGSGDVLTGIILSLMSQKYSPKESCILGVYIHGLAGDIYANNYSQESLIASNIIDCIGDSFKKIKNEN